jgi:hypothetical protein
MTRTLLTELTGSGQLSIGLVFALSSVTKLRRPRAFARNVHEYRVLPEWASRAIAVPIIAVELAIALALLTGVLAAAALVASLVVLTIFLAAVGFNLRRGRRVACGCFGSSAERISRRSAARLLILLAVTATLLLLWRGGYADEAGLTTLGTASLDDLLSVWLVSAALLVLGSWALRLPDIVAMVRIGRRADIGLTTQEVTV